MPSQETIAQNLTHHPPGSVHPDVIADMLLKNVRDAAKDAVNRHPVVQTVRTVSGITRHW